MPDGPLIRGFLWATEQVDRRWPWHRLPKVLSVPTMLGLRMALRRHNLFDTSDDHAGWGPEPVVPGRRLTRSADGSETDPTRTGMGSARSRFGRNVPLARTYRQEVLEPDPRTISRDLLARRRFIPATDLNLLTAAWIQFEVHDWMMHRKPEPSAPWELPLDDDDPWPTRPMEIRQTPSEPSPDGPPTYGNTQSHWWDASQVYGSNEATARWLRTDDETGHLRLTDDGQLPFDPPRHDLPDIDLSNAANWWVGLAMFHTLFAREHNAICDHLACHHPNWCGDKLYDTARLVNAALIAKIHTLEWTPALFAHPETKLGMKVNWWGFQGERLTKQFGRLTKSELLSGIPGSDLYYHGAAYAITEEFAAVYRMHQLIPDDVRLCTVADGAEGEPIPFDRLAGRDTLGVLQTHALADLFYSFGISHPGAVVLHNFPEHLRTFRQPDGELQDLAAIDIVRNRERGVPRYNEFRELFRLPTVTTFEGFSDDPSVVADLRRIYANPDDVDLLIGMYAEAPPKGLAVSDTAFRVFLLMASRRLKSDRFFTSDYTPNVYSQEGLDWIAANTLSSVLRRHFGELEPTLRGVDNAFQPWHRIVPGTTAPVADHPEALRRWRPRRALWDFLVRFKFRQARPIPVPIPSQQRPIVPVPFGDAFPGIPIDGLAAAQRVPDDENRPAVMLFVRVQSILDRLFPPRVTGLPSIDADPERALADAYPPAHRDQYRPPIRPLEYDGMDLGALAIAGPHACYLEADDAGMLTWDLTELAGFECHAGLHAPVARVQFELDDGTRRLAATRIDSALGVSAPGDADWAASQRLALCAAATHLTLVRHFNWIHLVGGAPFAWATHNALPPTHPIRRLLQPHVYLTQFSNKIVTIPQLEPNGDFESVFSFTHRGVCDVFGATCGSFDLRLMEPSLDATRRGIARLPVDQPALDNRRTLMRVIRDHVDRYLTLYYDDAGIVDDAHFARWLHELRTFVPHGVDELVGTPVTLDGATTLLATLIYMVTVDHEIVDSGVWDYQLWSDVQPVRVYADGRRLPLDVYQRLVNSNFILNVDRTRLTTDFSYLALDPPAANAFRRFRRELVDLQRSMDGSPASCWRIEPRQLKANMNY